MTGMLVVELAAEVVELHPNKNELYD